MERERKFKEWEWRNHLDEDSKTVIEAEWNAPGHWVLPPNPTKGWKPAVVEECLVREPKGKHAEVRLNVNRFLSDGKKSNSSTKFKTAVIAPESVPLQPRTSSPHCAPQQQKAPLDAIPPLSSIQPHQDQLRHNVLGSVGGTLGSDRPSLHLRIPEAPKICTSRALQISTVLGIVSHPRTMKNWFSTLYLSILTKSLTLLILPSQAETSRLHHRPLPIAGLKFACFETTAGWWRGRIF